MSRKLGAKGSSSASGGIVHLVIAALAVGGFSLERAWDLRPKLERQGLVDPKAVEMLDEAEVVRRLAICGYDRGPIVTAAMASRLIALHAAVRKGVLAQTSELMQSGRVQDAEKMLCRIKGVGPMVFRQFAVLEGIEKKM